MQVNAEIIMLSCAKCLAPLSPSLPTPLPEGEGRYVAHTDVRKSDEGSRTVMGYLLSPIQKVVHGAGREL